jgi:hypothetical protein
LVVSLRQNPDGIAAAWVKAIMMKPGHGVPIAPILC